MLEKFLFEDYDRFDGRLRFAFYALLLIFGYPMFVHDIPAHLASTPEGFYWPDGMMQWISRWVSFGQLRDFVHYTGPLLIACWIFSAVGFLGRWPLRIVGIIVLIDWGIFKGASGTSHTWHLPVYALFILGLFVRNDTRSLDYLIGRKWTKYPFAVQKDPSLNGFALKMVLVASVYTLFAGGVSKLIHGGFQWMDGVTLQSYIVYFGEPKTTLGVKFYYYVKEHPWIAQVLSVWTIALEVGSVFTLFYRRLRFPFFVQAWIFHLGIYMLMLPRYFPQMIVYLLIIPWGSLQLKSIRGWKNAWKWMIPEVKHLARSPLITRVPRWTALLFFGVLVALLGTSVWLQKEFYPLTHVPMYSNTLAPDKIGDIHISELEHFKGLKHAASEYVCHEQPWYLTFYFPRYIVCERHDSSGTEEIEIPRLTNRFLWNHRVTHAFLADIQNARDSTGISFDHTQQLLESLSERLHTPGNYRLYYKFELTKFPVAEINHDF